MDIGKLNEIFYNTSGIEIQYSEDDLILIETLNNIVNDNTVFLNPLSTPNISIFDSLKLVKEFFENINSEYANMYIENVRNNIINFYDDNCISTFDIKVDKNDFSKIYKEINIGSSDNYNCSFNLVHENVHSFSAIDFPKDIRSWYYISEFSTMFFEKLFADYINREKIVKARMCDTYNSLLDKSMELHVELILLKKMINNGFISSKDVYNINYDSYIEKLIDQKSSNIELHSRYIIGNVLACYAYIMYKNKKMSLDKIFYIIDNLDGMYFEDLLELLDIHTVNDKFIEFTEESKQKLTNSYVKCLRRRR